MRSVTEGGQEGDVPTSNPDDYEMQLLYLCRKNRCWAKRVWFWSESAQKELVVKQ